MSKSTPGPWEAAEHGAYGDYDGQCRVILGDDLRIAVVLGFDTEETGANANLIAAAPDLLEALDDLILSCGGGEKTCGHEFDCNCAFKKAMLARNKARGEI